MRNFYILEGPDGVGKSTLVTALAANVHKNPIIIHASGDAELWPSMHAYHESILDIAERNLENEHVVILDRHWPSEVVYHPVFRPNLVRNYDANLMKGRIAGLGGLYICCLPTIESQKFAMSNESFQPQQYQKVCELYMDLFAKMQAEGSDCFMYNREHWDNMQHRAAMAILAYNQHRP